MTRPLRPLLAALLLPIPLAAQSFGDRPAFGGSQVFSGGLDPQGNSARFDRLPQGWYLGFEGGDDKTRRYHDASEALGQALQAGDAAAAAGDFQQLLTAPPALRREAYGLEYAATGGLRFAFGRELTTGVQPLDSQTALARRVEVNRFVAGAGSGDGSSAYGITLRVEHLRVGQQGVPGLPEAALGLTGTDRSAWSVTSDAGFTAELTQGLRFGLTVTRLLPRHFWDVYERPQARAGFELDLGETVHASLEGDLNEAVRLPVPVQQRTLSSSLSLQASPTVLLQVGAERRIVGGIHSTLAGVTVRVATAPFWLGLGFQFGNDRPQRALALRVGS